MNSKKTHFAQLVDQAFNLGTSKVEADDVTDQIRTVISRYYNDPKYSDILNDQYLKGFAIEYTGRSDTDYRYFRIPYEVAYLEGLDISYFENEMKRRLLSEVFANKAKALRKSIADKEQCEMLFSHELKDIKSEDAIRLKQNALDIYRKKYEAKAVYLEFEFENVITLAAYIIKLRSEHRVLTSTEKLDP
jgi:hypothetical protein